MNLNNENQIAEIQSKLLSILLYFQQFCRQHNLKFTLAGGTCLGAVRHGGFIPWDDDLDVFMLREDYEKLYVLWQKYADIKNFSCVKSNDKINIHHAATEIKDNNTTFINKHSVDLDINHGLMIDVIPLDVVAENKMSRFKQYFYSMLFCCFNFQRLPEHKSKLIYFVTKCALALVRSPKTRYRIWNFSEKQFSKNAVKHNSVVASFIEGTTIMRQHFPVDWFLKPKELSFEGYIMPVPADTHKYLTMSYGDYMQLPPESERVCRHDVVFWDMHKSYKEYRGIKYYVRKD